MSAPTYSDSHTTPGKGRQYDAYYGSDPWARYLWSREQEVLAQALDAFLGGREVRALDFACGTGRICGFLESRVASQSGVDVSEAMLAEARAKLTRTTLVTANLLESSPFEEASFDLITAFRFFVNAEPSLRKSVMRALAKLLRPDGVLIFNDHQNIDSPYWRAARAYADWRGFARFSSLSIAECQVLVGEVGLEIVRVYPVGLLRVPKLELPAFVQRAADRLLGLVPFAARWTTSPILVARRRA
ncbi:MAG: methyltransferase domain-containing protein [Myxococcota bacterium]